MKSKNAKKPSKKIGKNAEKILRTSEKRFVKIAKIREHSVKKTDLIGAKQDKTNAKSSVNHVTANISKRLVS